MSAIDIDTVRDLRISVQECSDRGLLAASQWAAELLLSIAPQIRHASLEAAAVFQTSTPTRSRSPRQSLSFTDYSPIHTQVSTQIMSQIQQRVPARHRHAPPVQSQPQHILQKERNYEAQEYDLLMTAKACMMNREYARVEPLLHDCESAKARFLAAYSIFLVTEGVAKRYWDKLDNNRHQPKIPVNETIIDLLPRVENETDPWLLFLKGLFLSRLSRREEAIESAFLSIATFPWNWASWALLSSCIGDGDELSALMPLLPLPPTHPVVQMFQIKTLNELHSPSDNELGLCDRLLYLEAFPGSLWIMSMRACVLYHLHDFDSAERQFDRILAIDPHRVDDIDVYSNILYVTENRLKLSRLAHDFLATDKDRPEVCALVGNHYSLRAEHERAIKYFRRATQLDGTYLAAWTLMGHEYVEMKNSQSAIESYRRAIDVNRKDYRAWYGLGQAYELLNMHFYSLHYYEHATALRPYDVRLWQAQGMCFEEMGRYREAVECLKRALIPADPHEITINLKLAKIYNTMREYSESTAYHRRVVEVCQADQRPVQDYSKSCLAVAEHQLSTMDGDLPLAISYLETVASSNSEDVTRAAELLRVAIENLKMQEEKAKNKAAETVEDSLDMKTESPIPVVPTNS